VTQRIVLLGATGYTGELTARALVDRGCRPVLAGRDHVRLERLARRLGSQSGGAVVSGPESLRNLLRRGDVLVTTVGPFLRLGDVPAVTAIAAGANYLDSNGEPPFTRRIFEHYGPTAFEAGIVMLPTFGWECVLGNLAGALALRDAVAPAVRVDTGYFYTGPTRYSGGSRASFAGAMVQPGFAYRNGATKTERAGRRCRSLPVDGSRRPGVSFGASEHIALPRSFPQVREVNAYLGWFGALPASLAYAMPCISRAGTPVLKMPGVRSLFEAIVKRVAKGSTGGPSVRERKQGGVHVVGMAYSEDGDKLAEVHLNGAEGYEFTARILAWGAERVLADRAGGVGALGPVEAFDIDELEAGCKEAGVIRV
jgi:short subunit dehydrogenase-like uncharacterized protein